MANNTVLVIFIWTVIVCVAIPIAILLYNNHKSEQRKTWRKWYDESKSGHCEGDI